MQNMVKKRWQGPMGIHVLLVVSLVMTSVVLLAGMSGAHAHHILGRPSYALNEDSNTPPSLQVEARIGAYAINYMIYPAFPRPGQAGRINLYVKNAITGNPYVGKITFLVRDNSWAAWAGFESHEEKLGAQVIDDNVFRQGFIFREPGAYIVRASFDDGDEPHMIDFPLQVGEIPGFGTGTKIAGFVIFVLIALSIFQRRRVMTGRIRSKQDGKAET